MEIQETKTSRGFTMIKFKDSYGTPSIIQESSNINPHLWIGIDNVPPKILVSDAVKLGIDIGNRKVEGWMEYPLPDRVLLDQRMHINKDLAKFLIEKLQDFIDNYPDTHIVDEEGNTLEINGKPVGDDVDV